MSTTDIFRITAPAAEDFAAFHAEGYVAFPAVLSDAGLAGLTDEILRHEAVAAYLEKSAAEPDRLRLSYRNWDDKDFWSDQLIDAPLVKALLQGLDSEGFHFCHSTLSLSLPGAAGIDFHQDHHHWKHDNPINIAERQRWYIQMLYYPNGFRRSDASLALIPGSQRIGETPDLTPAKLLSGECDEEAGRPLKEHALELPAGSMVFLNARCFHAVAAKPVDSPQQYRLFANYIFKEVGPPHRCTQPIPPQWLEGANSYRKSLFERPAYTPEIWPLTQK